MKKEYLDVVDENDNPIALATAYECHEKGLRHRASFALLYNKEGKLLIQRRALNKVILPGKLCCSMSGHLKVGESYLRAAQREVKEELGITTELIPISKIKREIRYEENGLIDNQIITIFLGKVDEEVKINEEVHSTSYMSEDEFREKLAKDPELFAPLVEDVFQSYLKFKKENI